MRRSLCTLAIASAFLLAAVAAFAGGKQPALQIESPAQNATVRGNAVSIAFRTRDFKVVSLKNFVVPGARGNASSVAPASADEGMPTPGMSATESAPGMGRSYSEQGASSGGNNPEQVGSGSGMSQGEAPPPSVNPHEGFVVVKVDDSPFFFIHSTSDPILLAGMQPGAHKVMLQLVTDDGRPTGEPQSLSFTVAPAGTTPAPPQK